VEDGVNPSLLDVPLRLLAHAEPEDDSRLTPGDITELAASIQSVGLLQPIGVRRVDDGYFRIVYGHRRVRAVATLGWTHIPAVVVDADPGEDTLRNLVENLQRRQLSHQERALSLEQLLASGLTGRQIAERTGKPDNVIYSWLRVARSQPLMAALSEGRVGIHEARILSSLPVTTLSGLIPELQDRPEAFRMARIQRAIDDARTSPPQGFYRKSVEGRTRRLLVQIAELMKGVREVRTADELGLVSEICEMAGRWKRDVLRARSAPP
jgi:ParB/RepB/Spo0J family partition protein